MRLDLDDTEKAGDDVGTVGWHLMGTTRMADDPKHGVVDATSAARHRQSLCRLELGVPDGRYSNPTLTIVALALRLADHLAGRLR